MRQRNPKALARKLAVVGVDAVFAFAGSVLARLIAGKGPLVGVSSFSYVSSYLVLVGAVVAANARFGLYKTRHCTLRLQEWSRLLPATMTATTMAIVVFFLAKVNLSRDYAVVSYLCLTATQLLGRDLVRRAFRTLRRTGRLSRAVAIVGDNLEAQAISSLLQADRALGYNVVGYFGDGAHDRIGFHHLGGLDDVESLAPSLGLTGAIIATTAVEPTRTNQIVRRLTDRGFHVNLSSTLRDIAPERLCIVPIEEYPALYVEPVVRNGWRAIAKRATDITACVVGLIFAAPLIALAAIWIKLDSPGPVFFKQRRFGRNGSTIQVLKLRTMRASAEQERSDLQHLNTSDGLIFKVKNDPRITRAGTLLRRTSIDELPQLWNILRGDMSLVGPRPLPASDVTANWTEAAQYRLRVRPGLTGLWQVSARGQSHDDELLRFDLYYVDNWTVWADASIILRTVGAVLRGRGAF